MERPVRQLLEEALATLSAAQGAPRAGDDPVAVLANRRAADLLREALKAPPISRAA